MTYQLTIDDYIGRWCYSKQYVRSVLDSHKGKHVDVKISSLGGDLDHGLDIRQQFHDHGDVTVYLSGFVASSATVIAMGAKRVVMGKYAMFLVHKCSNFIDAWGAYNADQMQALIDELTANKKENDKIDVVLANMYAARCKKKVSEILDILKEGRWLTAQEAKEIGFVDEIADEEDMGCKTNLSQDLRRKFNVIGLPTAGLEDQSGTTHYEDRPKRMLSKIVDSIFGDKGSKKEFINQTDNKQMEKENKFTVLCGLLGLETITPDNDGYVSVTSGQFGKINDRLAQLEKSLEEKENTLKERDSKIAGLNAQVEALKGAPGDETQEIEDESGETAGDCKASSMFNSIKDII